MTRVPFIRETEAQLVTGISEVGLLSWYFQQMTGFFVPPITANYSFLVTGSMFARVYLGTDQRRATERVVAKVGFATWCDDMLCSPEQISVPLFLVANTPYWFRLTHQSGGGSDSVDVALRVHTDSNPAIATLLQSTSQVVHASVPAIFAIRGNVDMNRASWTVTIMGADSGMFALTVGGVAVATVDLITIRSWTGVYNDFACAVATAWGISCGIVGISYTGIYNYHLANPLIGYQFGITANSPLKFAGGWPPISVTPISLIPRNASVAPTVTVVMTSGASAPLLGSFMLTNGITIAPQTFQMCAVGTSFCDLGHDKLTTALRLLTGVIDVDVSSTSIISSGDAFEVRVVVWGVNGVTPNITAVTADAWGTPTITGSNASITVVATLPASPDPFYFPAPVDFFRFPEVTTVATVTTNGIASTCDIQAQTGTPSACAFVYNASLTPIVTAVAPAMASEGTTVTITGAGFLVNSTAGMPSALHSVSFNGSNCNVTAATLTTLTCVMGPGPAGSYLPSVLVGLGRGLAAVSGMPLLSIPVIVSSVSPRQGSLAGGLLLTITGNGFFASGDARQNVVLVGGAPCVVVMASFDVLMCTTPAGMGVVSITANGISAGLFTFDATLTPSIIALSPSSLSAAVSGIINISLAPGVNLTTAQITVAFGPRPCAPVTVTPQVNGGVQVSCRLVRVSGRDSFVALASTFWTPTVTVAGQGYASFPAGLGLDATFAVTSLSPQAASLGGGTIVHITGFGLLGRPGALTPTFDYTWPTGEAFSIPCTVTWVATDGSAATCSPSALYSFETPPPATVPFRNALVVTGTFNVILNNVTAPCAYNACNFSMSPATTPNVTQATTVAGTLFLTGSNLAPSLVSATPLRVFVGVWECTNAVASPDGMSANCTLPPGQVGWWPLSVSVGDSGNAVIAGRSSVVFLPLVVALPTAGAALPSGGAGGGQFLRLLGSGFGSDATAVTVNITSLSPLPSASSYVVGVSPTVLDILMPPVSLSSGWAAVGLSVSVTSASGFNVTSPLTSLAFNYTLSATPSITRVLPTSGVQGTVLTVLGTGFASYGAPGITIGGAPCAVTTYNSTAISCIVGPTPGGWHRVLVNASGGAGLAVKPQTTNAALVNFTALLSVTSMSTNRSSFGGGNVMQLRGSGFADPGAGNGSTTTITFCNAQCNVVSSTYNAVTCTTGSTLTPALLESTPGWAPAPLSATVQGTSNIAGLPVGNAVDGDSTTFFQSCTVIWDMGSATRALVLSVGWYPTLHNKFPFVSGGSATWRGSNDPTFVNTTILAAPGFSYEGWNSFNIADPNTVDLTTLPTFRYLLWQSAPGGSNCQAAELQFVGYAVAAVYDASTCAVSVTTTAAVSPAIFVGNEVGMTVTNSSLLLAYSFESTPVITAVTPNNGTALGGDTITLTGVGFVTGLTVALNGMPCAVAQVTATTVTCVTSPRTAVLPVSINLALPDGSTALYDASVTYFRYLDRWSALTTWRYNEPPVEGDAVIIPLGQVRLRYASTVLCMKDVLMCMSL